MICSNDELHIILKRRNKKWNFQCPTTSAVQKNQLVGQVLYRSLNPSKKRRQSGIYYEKECSSTHLSHAVLLTGFGQTKIENKVKKFFSIKNSWGEDWGENGYFRIVRKNNHCGISTVASFPVL